MWLTDVERRAILEWVRLLESNEFVQVRVGPRTPEGHCAIGVMEYLPEDVKERVRESLAFQLVSSRAIVMNTFDQRDFQTIGAWLRLVAECENAPSDNDLDMLECLAAIRRCPDRFGDEPLTGAIV
jgi:hypothetical protein